MRLIAVLLTAITLLADPAQGQVGGALYQKACDDGDMASCDVLGQMYQSGSGARQDATMAANLYRRACEGAEMAGCTHLAIMYANGVGVSQDIPQSVTLFEQSCDGGDAEGCEQLDYLMGLMTVTLFEQLPVEGRMLMMGGESQGSLTPGDATGPGGSFVQAWMLHLGAEQAATVDLLSEAFDPYLWIEGPGLDAALGDDDGAGGCAARVSFTAPQEGDFRVIASAANAGGAGPFTVRTSASPSAVAPGACTRTVAPATRGGRGGRGDVGVQQRRPRE